MGAARRRPVLIALALLVCVLGMAALWSVRPTPSPADIGIPLPPGAHVVSYREGVTRYWRYRTWDLQVPGMSVQNAARFYETRMPAAGYPTISDAGLFQQGEPFEAFGAMAKPIGPFGRSVDFEIGIEKERPDTAHILIDYGFRWNPF